MCDFRDPTLFKNLKLTDDAIIEHPEFLGSISFGDLGKKGFSTGLYQVVCTGGFFAYTNGYNWYSIDFNMEGHLIANR